MDGNSDDGFGSVAEDDYGPALSVASHTPSLKEVTEELQFDEQLLREAEVSAFQAQFRHSRPTWALPDLLKGPTVRMPWEGSSGASVVSDLLDSAMWVNRPALQRNVPEVLPVQIMLKTSASRAFPGAIRRLPLVSWPVQQVAKRHLVLQKWRLVLEENFCATALGLQLQDACLDLATNEQLASIVFDAFSERPTATLSKRVNPLLKCFIWVRKTFGVAAAPILEKRAYEHIKGLIDSKAAPTAPASFVSALNFAGHFVGMQGAIEAAGSLRVRGASHSHYLLKRMLKQSKLLLVVWVLIFENGVWICSEAVDKIACGYVCALLHSRARCSDLMHCNSVELDVNASGEGYVEFLAKGIKTARTKESKTQFVPYVAPVHGVASKPWAAEWLRQRRLQGIDKFSCMMPSLSSSGSWIDHPSDASTVTAWMTHILIKFGISVDKLSDLTSQGCKATALSWCSKFDMSIETRQLLGHHVLSSQTTCLTYSRDAQSGPLREYENMLSHIRDKTFLPDMSRSGRIVKRAKRDGPGSSVNLVASLFPPIPGVAGSDDEEFRLTDDEDEAPSAVLPREDPQEHPLSEVSDDSDSHSSAGSSDSSSSGSEVDCVEAARLAKKKPAAIPIEDGLIMYMCITSKLLHLKALGVQDKLKCGRRLSANFRDVCGEHAGLLLRCAQCFP